MQGRIWLVEKEGQGYSHPMNAMTDSLFDSNSGALDSEVCRRARLARDVRFDGEFYLGVSTTGIFCRPVCAARSPRESNVTYYRTAAQATKAGFRPCLRCRPESAPGSPAWQGTRTTVDRALTLIRQGALNSGNTEQLADRLGVGERYLRKLFQRELGVSPSTVAQTERLLFAKKLLAETELTITEIAYASGFGSTRRFNSFIRESMHCTPSSLRLDRQRKSSTDQGVRVQLRLQYRPPLDWAGLLNFYARHAISGVEHISDNSYTRSFRHGDEEGWMRVRDMPKGRALQLDLSLASATMLMPVADRVRTMFDLNANPQTISQQLSQDAGLDKLVTQFPGTRSPVNWSTFEAAVRAVVGQQVSLAGARTVMGDIVARSGERTTLAGAPEYLFPTPEQILSLESERLSMPRSRQATLMEVARYYATAAPSREESPWSALLNLRGIGPWTADMLAMRGYGQPDVLPVNDLVLIKAAAALDIAADARQLMAASHAWRPWRSYAANLLWRSFS